MQRTKFKHALAATFCLLVLAALLFLAACGSYSSPGSQPGGTPQATPTYGGYGIISLFPEQAELLHSPRRLLM
jgi:hypothetical protein